jgi:predicted ribosomally synthesized peptide with nif11-like leader
MPDSNAKDLVKKMAADKAFRESLEAAGSKEARQKILASAGFGKVTADQVKAVAKAEGQEVSDDDLEKVAGGLARVAGRKPGGGAGVTKPVEWAAVIIAAAALFV